MANSLRIGSCCMRCGRFLARHNDEGHVVLPVRTGVPQGGFPQPALDSVAKFLRRHPRIDIRRRLLETALVDWQGQFQLHQYAWSLDMCTRSWADESCVRVHIHAFLRHAYRLRVRHQLQLKFLGSLPVKSRCVGKDGRKDRCWNQGLYYVQCTKRGLVASGGNVLP